LARLLLERGAEPYDGQVVQHPLSRQDPVVGKLMYEFSVAKGASRRLNDPNGTCSIKAVTVPGRAGTARRVEKNDELPAGASHGAN
jgi:hypothetical protein